MTRPAEWSTAEMLERAALIFDSQAALACGSARAAHQETAAALRARAAEEQGERRGPPTPAQLESEGRCMHGNRPEICFVLFCRHPVGESSGRDVNHRNDLQELEAQNRAGCAHPRIPGALSNERAAQEASVGILLGRFDFAICPDCHRDVPAERARAVNAGA